MHHTQQSHGPYGYRGKQRREGGVEYGASKDGGNKKYPESFTGQTCPRQPAGKNPGINGIPVTKETFHGSRSGATPPARIGYIQMALVFGGVLFAFRYLKMLRGIWGTFCSFQRRLDPGSPPSGLLIFKNVVVLFYIRHMCSDPKCYSRLKIYRLFTLIAVNRVTANRVLLHKNPNW
jgi:hypothetical protein